MRFISIQCKNYRQFKNLCLQFPKTKDCDMHIIIASNGVGKTNLLNAVNWCLYGDEPHVTGMFNGVKEDVPLSDKLPLYNLDAIKDAISEGQQELEVSVTVTLEDLGIIYEIKRIEKYKPSTRVQVGRDTFECKKMDPHGGTAFLTGMEISEVIERFLPRSIREYFYFDGEQLLTYFSLQKRKNIQDSVSVIAQINVVNDVSDHLDKVMREYVSKINAVSPQLKEKENSYQNVKKERENKEAEIILIEQQILEADKAIAAADDVINGKEYVAEKNKQYDEYRKQLEYLEKDKEKLNDELIELVKKYLVKVLLYETNKTTAEYIKQRKESGTLYHNFTPDEIKDSINTCECKLCGSILDLDKVSKLKELLYKVSNNMSSQVISSISRDIFNAIDISSYPADKRRKFEEINEKDAQIESIQDKANEIWKTIGSYGVEGINDITEAIKIKDRNITLKAQNQEKKGKYQEQLENLMVKEKALLQEYELAVEANNINEQLTRYYNFSKKAKQMVDEIRFELAGKVRNDIAEETALIFQRLIWKKDTYGSVELDEKYNIKLYRKYTNESCLNSCSAAEIELLALAFTLAIHKVSGFNSFLFIDTPVGRVSDFNRENFAKVLLDVSTEKQIILAFTPSEYSHEISEVFNPNIVSSCSKLGMKNNITEVEING